MAVRFLIVASPVSMVAVFITLVMLAAVILAIASLVMRYIDIVVPPIAHEIDRLAAGIIFAAVLAPVFRMTRRHMHVDGLSYDVNRRGTNHDGSCVNAFRLRKISDVNASIKARLADTDRHTDIGCLCRGGDKGYHDGK